MKIAGKGFKLVLSILLISIIMLGCSEDDTDIIENSIPQIANLSPSNTIVGFGNSITLSVEGVDNDDDILTYSWSADGGTFSNNSKGKSLKWIAPSLSSKNSSQKYKITVIVSDGKDKSQESISIEVIPAYNDFVNNELLNFEVNTPNAEFKISSNQLVLESVSTNYLGVLRTPEFYTRLTLPYTIESTFGINQNFKDPNTEYYFISISPTYPSGTDNVLAAVQLYINPNKSFNWQLVAKTLKAGQGNYTTLIGGESKALKGIGSLNKISLSIDNVKNVKCEINGNVVYIGDVLKRFVESLGYATTWNMASGDVGIRGVNNLLTVEEIIVK